MTLRTIACAASAAAAGLIAGCSSPFDQSHDIAPTLGKTLPHGVEGVPSSTYRDTSEDRDEMHAIPADASPDEFVRYALYNSPEVEAAYQRWRAAAERLPQVNALPDPRVTFGFFLEEVQTRTGPQQARVGVSQTIPWPGRLQGREDAASMAAAAAWRRFEAVRLSVTERVVATLQDLAYLDATIAIAGENLELLRSFEEVLRARYRVGAGSHPELVRGQVELGQIEDRLTQLRAMRPAYVAELNATLNRPSEEEVALLTALPGRVASVPADELVDIARRSNPALLALGEQIEEQRSLAAVARTEGLPDLTVGIEYIITGEAMNSATPGSGDDPIMLSLGINVPLWREKYGAGVREALSRRLAASHTLEAEGNRIAAAIHRAWFEHTDADRRVRLYEQTLIPKAEESLRASLAGFRAGDMSFLDLLDTERTLLEFSIAAERARADRGKALARLHTLVGAPIPTKQADQPIQDGRSGEGEP